jgi:dipeptidyl aminopeptidase/acylaminoacyl peptidase
VAALVALLAGGAVGGALPIASVITLEAAGERFRDVALTADGRRVAWVEALDGRDGMPSSHSAIFVADLAPSATTATSAGAAAIPPATPRRITAGTDALVEGQLAWSPDGQRLAFISDAGHAAGGVGATGRSHPRSAAAVADSRVNASRTGAMRTGTAAAPLATDVDEPRSQRQIWVADLATGRVARITDVSGQISDLRWSPDGTAIAFLHIAGRDTAAGAVHAMPRDAGVVGETPEEQRLTIVDPATGVVNAISPADLFIYEYDWSPNGAAFVVTAAHGSGDDNWWIAELGILPRTGGAVRPLLRPRYQMACPRWSPDGRSIAFIGGLMSDQGVTGGDVYLLAADPAAGTTAGQTAGLSADQAAAARQARNLTPGRAASAAALAWTADARLLVFEAIDGDSGLARIDPATGDVAPLWRLGAAFTGPGASPGLALSRDGSIAAAIVSSFDRAPEVWAGPVSALSAAAATTTVADLGWRPLTRRNTGVRPAWGAARSLHWTSDGARVQGWLLAPPGAPPTSGAAGVSGAAGARPPLLPMVVLVHGGPASSHRAGWPRLAGVLASQGFYVLLPNPRGSYGQGEDFTRGNVKDFGYGDLRDILAGVDAAVAAAPIDPARIGLDGWSYGGYMAMWAVTQTQRFRAAVAGAGIVDWQSYYGQNGIDQWMIPYFGASVYDDPWIYARSSPITFIKAVHTPTLILQGERDAEVPAPQAYQFWRALRTLGVETRLVIYPDQGHHLTRTDNRDMEQRTVDWLTTHLR